MQLTPLRAALTGAGITTLFLFGGIIVGAGIGDLLFGILSGHSFSNPNPVHVLIAVLPTLVGFLAGSALWGISMGRLANAPDRKRMALAGALGFAPITIVLAVVLQILEPIAVEQLGAVFPIHRLFTFFFVPMAFLIVSISAWAIGKGLHNPLLARKLFGQVGITAALTFLLVNLIMEAFGYYVGAPGADERATMLTVLLTGDLGVALTGGAVMGVLLARAASSQRTSPPSPNHFQSPISNL